MGLIAGLAALALVVSYGTLVFLSRITVLVDGKTLVRYTLQRDTVQNLLDSFQVSISSADIVQPAPSEKLRWGERVRVIRVRYAVEEKEDEVDFVLNWKRTTTRNLRKVEIQDGYRKVTTWTVSKTYHDGDPVKSEEKLKNIRKIHVKRLVFLNESNYPIKTYDLSQAEKISVIATAYWLGDPQVPGDITFSGHKVVRGLVAVDPPVIPLGYRLYIPGYGYAYSSDTGSAIKGKRVDLFVESKQASREWEYRRVDVYILEKSKSW